MTTLKRFIKNFLALLFRPVFKYFPRNKKKFVYGASKSFRDNPKYLFYEANERHPEIRSIWISHKKGDSTLLRKQGYESFYWLSPLGLWHTLTASVFISDHSIGDINTILSGGAYFVNLWHGAGIKKVRWQAPNFYVIRYHFKSADEMNTSLLFRIIEYDMLFIKPDLLLAPSIRQAEMFHAPMLKVPLERCFYARYPRNRLLIEGKDQAKLFIKKYEPSNTLDFINKITHYNKSYIYMPTWRNDGKDFIKEAGIDWNILNDTLKSRNALLILRLHMFTSLDISSLSQYENICVYPKLSDIYSVLPFVDCLITDYSSIYTDFLIMNKEIILFVYDYKEYVNNSHELVDYDKYYLGTRAYNFNELIKIIGGNIDCSLSSEQYSFLMDYFWDNNQHEVDIIEEIQRRFVR